VLLEWSVGHGALARGASAHGHGALHPRRPSQSSPNLLAVVVRRSSCELLAAAAATGRSVPILLWLRGGVARRARRQEEPPQPALALGGAGLTPVCR